MGVTPAKENILKKIRQALSNPAPLPFPLSEGTADIYLPAPDDLEVVFAEAFIKLGGKFIFCDNEQELLQNIVILYENRGWDQMLCADERMLKLFVNNKIDIAEPATAAAEAADGHGGGHGDKKGDAKPGKKTKDSPELTRFEYTYMQIEREFLVNVSGSKKVMSVQIAVMTHYDDRVFENVKKHDFAIRSAVMDVMRLTTDADLVKPDFRKELAAKIRDAINTLLEKYEDFGGIEEIHFTNFIVQ